MTVPPAPDQEPRGIVLNTKSISFIVGLISIVTVFYTGVSYLNGQENRTALLEQRVNSLEARFTERDKNMREDSKILIDKLDKLQDQVTRLAFALNQQGK